MLYCSILWDGERVFWFEPWSQNNLVRLILVDEDDGNDDDDGGGGGGGGGDDDDDGLKLGFIKTKYSIDVAYTRLWKMFFTIINIKLFLKFGKL
jgi:hypothetical protein